VRARPAAGLVIAEATAISPEGRISPADLGIWSDAHVAPLARIVDFLHLQGAAAGIQLAHAGRKASTAAPWHGGGPLAPDDGGWPVVGASAIAYDEEHQVPHELTLDEVHEVIGSFVAAARRSVAAGFDVIELHGAHGYLLSTFHSPLSNTRTDDYGGDFAGRTRLTLEVIDAVRAAIPDTTALLLRLTSSDWVEGGWTIDDTVRLAGEAAARGVDLVDCSSGGVSPDQQITVAAGYQVPFAQAVRASGVASGAVGMIDDPAHADQLIRDGDADVVLLARELLRDPAWPIRAAIELGQPAPVPKQYLRAYSRSVVAAAT
jgi:2,4-dienoyl-CoA reductase-like NADH-dependent reductase (Old Yellow Enzyme family)